MTGCSREQARHAVQAWSQRAKAGLSKRASSGESAEPGDGQPGSPRGEHRSHSISSKALHHGATAYPSEMQLQQVRARCGRPENWSSCLHTTQHGAALRTSMLLGTLRGVA